MSRNHNRNNKDDHGSMAHSSTIRKRTSILQPASTDDVSSLLPTDRESLFARLDSAIESAAEEDAGRIPKDLLIGPSLKVESAGKKRRIAPLPTIVSSHSAVTKTETEMSSDTAPLPALSSPSSSSLSLDLSSNSHIIDKRPSKKSVRITTPTRSTRSSLEVVPSSIQSDSSSSFLLEQEHTTYPRTRLRCRQIVAATPLSQTPPIELSAISSSTIQESRSTRIQSYSKSHDHDQQPPLIPILSSPSPPESFTRAEEEMKPLVKPTSEALIPHPTIFASEDTESTGHNINVSNITITSPAPLTAIDIGNGNDPPLQSISITEKHRTSLDEPASYRRPSKKRGYKSKESADAVLPTSTLIDPQQDNSSQSSGGDGSSSVLISTTKSGGKNKKEKTVLTTVANRIGSRRKQHIIEGSSAAAPLSLTISSTMVTRSSSKHTNTTPLRKVGSVIEIADDNDGDKSVPLVITIDPPSYTNTIETSSSKTLTIDPFTLTSNPKLAQTRGSPLTAPSGNESAIEKDTTPIRLYVIPTLMDKLVFSLSRDRILQLKWEWLGPLEKILSTDPRGIQDIPPLDQERTTHIVTALSDLEKVKRFLNVENINPKIEIVNNLWLTDTIMYKKPMEPEGYRISRPKPYQHTPIKTPFKGASPPSHINHQSAESIRDKLFTHAKFESADREENHEQQDFNDIVLGIKEGSLEGGEPSDDDLNYEEEQESEEGYNKAEHIDTDSKETETNADITKLAPEVLEKLKKENRCFKCQEQGHWANKCPKYVNKGTKDEVLLQIINSGKSEGKRRSKILYRCQEPHNLGQKDEPKYNKAILEQLKILMDHYENIKVKGSNEHFKVINYRKAITAIRALDYEIKSEEMALKIPRVGKKLAQKIGECVALGRIKKLDHLNWDQEKSKTESLFRSVYGVGSEKATEWYNNGLRTLDDLRALPNLNKNQIIGLKYYDDLLKRIPRSEVKLIGEIVEAAAHKLHPEIQSQVTGSYRRGQPDCGDIDIVVARPNVDNGDELFMIMDHILKELIDQGFLIDHLSLPVWEDNMATRPKHFKYMGICKLSGENQIHRHIDILVVPWMHLGAVLLYFTGNDICNRSMRLLAANRGMRLSDKGLFDSVIRDKNRKKVNEGQWVAGRTEREIFDYLKIKYLEPWEREC